MLDLNSKTVLVTGASSGIGRQVAIYLSELGAKVFITGRDENRLNETYKQLHGNEHLLVKADLTQEDDIKSLFAYSKQNNIKFNGLVHCAGISCVMPIKVLTKESLQKVFDTNYFSFIDLVKEFAKKTNSENDSSIVVLSSEIVRHPRKFEIGYIASKAAIEASLPTIAMEYKDRSLRINAVGIGFSKIGMTITAIKKYDNEEKLNKEVQEKSLYGWTEAVDIAKNIAFLISNESKIINGRCINIDGGIF